jgi:phenylalanyl-tRNA synthetase beta chain
MASPTDRVNQIKNILAGLGLNEVITYSLIDKDLLSSFSGDVAPEAIEILNPLSQDQEILRPSLLPGLARCIAYNLNQKQEHINIFELAKVFLPIGAAPREELVLGIGLCGVKSLLLEQGALKDEMGLLHLKGIAESLFERLNIRDCQLRPDMGIYVHQEKIGFMLKLGRRALDRVQIKNKDVFVLELSLDKLFAYARQEKRFTPAAKYPAVERDISFILKEDIPLKKVQELIREKAGSLLRDIKVIDYYKGKQIPAGWRGITLACFYRADDRTLTEAEVNPLHNQVCAALTQGLGISIR